MTPTDQTHGAGSPTTSPRKAVVERYMDGFRRSDNAQILSCLTDDIVWDIEGFAHLEGKAAYDAEIDNPAFVGDPTLDVERMVEEDDTIIITGKGSATRVDGGTHRFAFADVFEFRGDLICHRQAFVVPLEPGRDPIG